MEKSGKPLGTASSTVQAGALVLQHGQAGLFADMVNAVFESIDDASPYKLFYPLFHHPTGYDNQFNTIHYTFWTGLATTAGSTWQVGEGFI